MSETHTPTMTDIDDDDDDDGGVQLCTVTQYTVTTTPLTDCCIHLRHCSSAASAVRWTLAFDVRSPGPFLWLALWTGTRYQTIFEIRHILLTVSCDLKTFLFSFLVLLALETLEALRIAIMRYTNLLWTMILTCTYTEGMYLMTPSVSCRPTVNVYYY